MCSLPLYSQILSMFAAVGDIASFILLRLSFMWKAFYNLKLHAASLLACCGCNGDPHVTERMKSGSQSP